ncbi:PKD domain-containing protein [Arthrobacter sp. M4]|uniref:PKD domain-containing protein n=1 Tax=Arthrobacter sp. M4 TaxID=218160 RepID=UPI001CDD01AE|nr:PKD domain-containing protein [Arthrobacter sp. M4]MCA4135040.1 PKD domain-containing protein [Arthrobacter sp. M4]
MNKPLRRTVHLIEAGILVAAALIGMPAAATADPNYGTQSISYAGPNNPNQPPTADKPQSKLWFNDGSWWADMWTQGRGWTIYRLDRGSAAWIDTGVLIDTRNTTSADTLWDGTHLYIATHVVAPSSKENPVPSYSGQPAKLFRYSYANGNYTLDPGFPATISNNTTESLTIDEDSTGAIWATWTQVGSSATNYTTTVYVNYSAPGGSNWATPFVLPVSNPNPTPDDISAIVAFGSNKIGVMWSDQAAGAVWWAMHTDTTDPTAASSWNVRPAIQGKKQADDHLNIKTLLSDPSGKVYAAVKTSLNETTGQPDLPQELLLIFRPGTGSFTSSTIATTGDCVSRPQVLLDTQNNLVRVFHTAPSTSVTGCAFSGMAGSIYEKTASMDNPVFDAGRGTPVIQDGSSANINNVTTTKQPVNAATGVVVLATDHVTKRYWFSDRSLAPVVPVPVASFTATPDTGAAPLPVTFADTSAGQPTSWSWNFGDGATSTVQNPSHTYASAGSYLVTLTATNSSGSSASSGTITVNPPPPHQEVVVVASSVTSSSTAVGTVTVPAPAGLAAGDVLVASITTDLNPSMASVPVDWVPIVNALSINSSASGGARVFSYYHVVGAADPASYSWTLSLNTKWGAGITAYRGVDNTSPLDTGVVTAVNTTYSATSITVGSITTVTNGALLIGGLGFDAATPGATPPSGWTERWESTGGQIAELADVVQATAGASGTATWTFSSAKAVGVWRTALRPAS